MTNANILPARTPALSMPRPPRLTPARLREMLLAGVIVLAASAILHAQDGLAEWTQDWMPDVLAPPQDAELLTDRAVGSTIRLFSFSTSAEVDTLFTEWEAALRDGGFQIDQGADDLLDRSIEFSGTGITNAKIVAGVTDQDGRTVIEVDATLE
ncbi:hypothetical protein [Roseicyclus marinus]|uniref:hypothetical protein n=1 Tax=Roseicyclus marinus TaxID=2161673 RepID=UPI00240FD64A|nr:hypothetical protein [Roseicyclus marinus]MDG3041151.1 hypothetical protein [Roseicyclus marinus]